MKQHIGAVGMVRRRDGGYIRYIRRIPRGVGVRQVSWERVWVIIIRVGTTIAVTVKVSLTVAPVAGSII